MALFDGVLAAAQILPQRVQGISGNAQTNLTGPDELGCFPFDPSQFYAGDSVHARTIVLTAVLNVSVGGQTVTLELFNKSDGVTVASITSTSLTPAEVRSAALSLAASRKLYGLRLSRTGGTSSDYVVCKYAALEVSFS
jgi:hypothetical protein